MNNSVGGYIAQRLVDLDVSDYFAIPGDYNLVLLDEIIKEKQLNMICCCNELNASYAADGYARVNGIAALFVTFGVGGLSAINGITGSYAENLPVLIVSGAPNTNSIAHRDIVHHTIATEDHGYVRRMFAEVCCHTDCIISPEKAPMQIDTAIQQLIYHSKPVYLDIACNISALPTPELNKRHFYSTLHSDQLSLNEATNAVAERINESEKPVIVVGSGCRNKEIGDAIAKLSTQTGIAFATMPDAKGFLSEEHPNYLGHYWGPVSSENVCELVESSDCYIFVGANINDYTTSGYTTNISNQNLIKIDRFSTSLQNKFFTQVFIEDLIKNLKNKVNKNKSVMDQFALLQGETKKAVNPSLEATDRPTTREFIVKCIQHILTSDNLLLVETGDSWFNGLDITLPQGCHFEIQMQYGSIGWSVGALLGTQAALGDKRRAIALIGDGSFQMTAQELSTMIRYGLKPIIFLVNNASYGIEVQIHDGPYNEINDWSYAQLVEVFRGQNMDARSVCVTTEKELKSAVEEAVNTDALYFIEVKIDANDCNKKLLQWGKYVAHYNSRKPSS
ncbi:MAG: thiamine pyrophosphate-dependent enzyme [Mariniblastus sp.]|nr:thiamine pyrophosphate-dependent enzyme [Mariniblastus sp.]